MKRFDRFTESTGGRPACRGDHPALRHNQIDTEHILLALIEQPGGVIPQILEKLSVSPEALTERLDATFRASIRPVDTHLIVKLDGKAQDMQRLLKMGGTDMLPARRDADVQPHAITRGDQSDFNPIRSGQRNL